MLNADVRGYLRQVRKHLPMCEDAEEKYLDQIALSLADYCAENSPASAGEITEAFGSPEDVVDAYLSEMDTGRMIRQTDIRKPVKACVLAALAVVMLAVLTAGIVAFWYAEESKIIRSYDAPTYFSQEAPSGEDASPDERGTIS